MRIALAQINPTVGDIDGNAVKVIAQIQRAEAEGADVVILPELCVFGYPPKDLVLRKDIVRQNVEAVNRIAARCTRLTAIVGCVQPDPSGAGKGVFNAAAVCRGGTIEAWYAKMLLPTYDVFDESRYFNTGREERIVEIGAGGKMLRAGLTICEDLWNNQQFEGRQVYGIDPIERTVAAGAELIVNISASPYRAGVEQNRERLFAAQVREHSVPLVYVNQVGGNDDLVFDGASMALDAAGSVVARAKAFAEDFLVVDFDQPRRGRIEAQPDRIDGIRSALVLGLGDYVAKCGFGDVLVGLSGGIDSAVTAAVAVEALGAKRVHGVAMPSRFSSAHSIEDAEELASHLGVELFVLPIEGAHGAFENTLLKSFTGRRADVTEENIQARIRGVLLMALCNKFGWMLLTTGNKSELAVGYCTLYGDMCGGLALISDVPKTTVYELAREINRSVGRALIPQRTIDKVPSAELRENQTDQDTLPPYEILDAILEQYVEQARSPDEIVAMGFERGTVERIAKMVRQNEYKRKQAAVGIKVTSKAFGTGRRFPIAAKYL
jgi:NAD+ synthetase